MYILVYGFEIECIWVVGESHTLLFSTNVYALCNHRGQVRGNSTALPYNEMDGHDLTSTASKTASWPPSIKLRKSSSFFQMDGWPLFLQGSCTSFLPLRSRQFTLPLSLIHAFKQLFNESKTIVNHPQNKAEHKLCVCFHTMHTSLLFSSLYKTQLA